jgi:hypothetical protein
MSIFFASLCAMDLENFLQRGILDLAISAMAIIVLDLGDCSQNSSALYSRQDTELGDLAATQIAKSICVSSTF